MADAVVPEDKSARGRFRAWLPLVVFVSTSVFSLYVWQSAQSQPAAGHRPLSDGLLLGYGIAVGALLALAIHLRRLARDRAHLAEQALARLREANEQNQRVRDALDAAERELGSIFESISDAFYTLDREWRFTLLNPRACQLMRLPREQLLGRVVWELFPETVGTTIEREFRRAVDESRTVEFEIHFPPLDTWFAARFRSPISWK